MDPNDYSRLAEGCRAAWRAELAGLTAAGLKPRYPWAAFLDGSAHELVAGLDFRVSPSAMRTMLMDQARKRGLRVRTRVEGDVLTVKVLQPMAAEASDAE